MICFASPVSGMGVVGGGGGVGHPGGGQDARGLADGLPGRGREVYNDQACKRPRSWCLSAS